MAPFKQSKMNNGVNTSYFTKDSTLMKRTGSNGMMEKPEEAEKYLNRKRQLYNGVHEVPCFNLKYTDTPILLSFRFSVFRMNSSKRKIFIGAKMLQGQPAICQRYVHANAHLLLELNEKQA
jgi:hypothetical protein